MIPNINLDTIFSDPLLLIATILLILGPLIFLFALVKFVFSKKSAAAISAMDDSSEPQEPAPEPPVPLNVPPYIQEEVLPPPVAGPPLQTPKSDVAEKTTVMPPGTGEIQGQIEIAFSQIKNLNKKVFQIESEIESLSRNAATKLETHELKDPPMNAGDFIQKLLKLAEHVIVLEKEVARIKAGAKTAATAAAAQQPTNGAPAQLLTPEESTLPPTPKPPIMPI